ncbi:hypothetical protein J2X98_002251 [Pseudarthrobacter enclensis]|uniref:Uncharacterized protein n=1 Tax=Pseudarthrobacter enclensis TaxID=993070 RepID=A0ABT9RTT8_9MICC|nr:hypothetical protein [Pseudarthrobacter enclensis]
MAYMEGPRYDQHHPTAEPRRPKSEEGLARDLQSLAAKDTNGRRTWRQGCQKHKCKPPNVNHAPVRKSLQYHLCWTSRLPRPGCETGPTRRYVEQGVRSCPRAKTFSRPFLRTASQPSPIRPGRSTLGTPDSFPRADGPCVGRSGVWLGGWNLLFTAGRGLPVTRRSRMTCRRRLVLRIEQGPKPGAQCEVSVRVG